MDLVATLLATAAEPKLLPSTKNSTAPELLAPATRALIVAAAAHSGTALVNSTGKVPLVNRLTTLPPAQK